MVCMYVCMYVCMDGCLHVSIHICFLQYVHVCLLFALSIHLLQTEGISSAPGSWYDIIFSCLFFSLLAYLFGAFSLAVVKVVRGQMRSRQRKQAIALALNARSMSQFSITAVDEVVEEVAVEVVNQNNPAQVPGLQQADPKPNEEV